MRTYIFPLQVCPKLEPGAAFSLCWVVACACSRYADLSFSCSLPLNVFQNSTIPAGLSTRLFDKKV